MFSPIYRYHLFALSRFRSRLWTDTLITFLWITAGINQFTASCVLPRIRIGERVPRWARATKVARTVQRELIPNVACEWKFYPFTFAVNRRGFFLGRRRWNSCSAHSVVATLRIRICISVLTAQSIYIGRSKRRVKHIRICIQTCTNSYRIALDITTEIGRVIPHPVLPNPRFLITVLTGHSQWEFEVTEP